MDEYQISMAEMRQERIIEQTMKALLQRGKVPTPEETSMYLTLNLGTRDLKEPFFLFKADPPNSTISSAKYNKDLSNIVQDISDMNTMIDSYRDSAYGVFNYFNIKRDRIEAELQDLRDLVDEIKLKSKNNILKSSYSESFTSLGNIDVAATTAEVDIKKRVACIPHRRETITKYDLDISNTSIELQSTSAVGISSTQNDNVYNILSDGNEAVWTYTISSPIQLSNELSLTISINSSIIQGGINTLELKTLSIKPTTVKIQASKDKINWTNIATKVSNNSEALMFVLGDPGYLYFKITLSKTEADKLGSTFGYIYGIENISLYYKEFLESATLQTAGIPIPENATKYSFYAADDIPDGTSIEYHAKVGDIWDDIEKSDKDIYEYTINNHSEESKMFKFSSTEATENTRVISQIITNGKKFFLLGSVSGSIIKDSAELYRGLDCWKKTTFIKEQSSTFKPSPIFFNDQLATVKYTPVTGSYSSVADNDPADANSNIKYSCSIYCNTDQQIQVMLDCNTLCALYVNDTFLYSASEKTNTKIQMNLTAGWNTIEIAAYTSTSKQISISLLPSDLDSVIIKMYGDISPLRQVTLHDLRYNVHPNDMNVYAIDGINSTTNLQVILNHYFHDIDYKIDYQYVLDDKPETIVIKADLYQDISNTTNTPTIKSMNVRFV